MGWFTRKIQPWDDNYDVTTAFIDGPATNWQLDFIIPSDRFIIPTSIALSVVLSVIAPGALRTQRIEQRRHDKVLSYSHSAQNSGGLGVWTYVWAPGLPETTGNITYDPHLSSALAFPWHFHPGDILRFSWGRHDAGDAVTQMRVTYRYWKIY